jgi:hypothetical protein
MIMAQSLKESIRERLEQLPEPALQEVLDFVDFISQKTGIPEEPMLAVAGTLSGSPLSVKEIERELYGGEREIP